MSSSTITWRHDVNYYDHDDDDDISRCKDFSNCKSLKLSNLLFKKLINPVGYLISRLGNLILEEL